MKTLIIGAGNMGLTFAQSFIHANVIRPGDLYFLSRSTRREEDVRRLSRHAIQQTPGSWISDMELIVIAVKPQDFPGLGEAISGFLSESHLVLSIMAGVSVGRLRAILGTPKVIRAMPNLPAQVGRGMTVFTTTPEVGRAELLVVHNLLNTTGQTLYTDSEVMIDAATAISGSGPGYVFFIMDAMTEKARQLGFSESEAQLLVRQTFMGSLDLLHQSDLNFSEWVARVASRGGTTEAALKTFDQERFTPALERGLQAAFDRARSLGD